MSDSRDRSPVALLLSLADARRRRPPRRSRPEAPPASRWSTLPSASSPLVSDPPAVRRRLDPRSRRQGGAGRPDRRDDRRRPAPRSAPTRSWSRPSTRWRPAIDANTDREVTLIAGTVHRDKLDRLHGAPRGGAAHSPASRRSDFERNKEQLAAALTNGLRSNDELLGLELLQDKIFAGPPLRPLARRHGRGPEEHHPRRRQGLLQAALHPGQPDAGRRRRLPGGLRRPAPAGPRGPARRGRRASRTLPPAPKVEGRNFTLVEKETGSVGIHFGYPAAHHPRRRRLLPADGGQQLPRRAPHLQRPPDERAARQAGPELRRLLLHRVLGQPAVHQQPDARTCRGASSTSRSGSARWCPSTPSSPCAPASTRCSGCATRG